MIATAAGDDSPELPSVPGFILEKELGRGGVGVVYLAKQVDLGRRVALKMLLSRAHSSSTETQRFYGEAESMALLQHPNLVTVFQIGRHDGLPFIVMEYLNGGTLAEKFKTQAYSKIPEAVQLMAQLAEAVGYCHDHGIIHRDLKPANILFNQDGIPKVTDFGMAKRLEQAGELTTSGTMLGTPNYMAPEQATGQSKLVNAPADVWALGVLMYEAVTGRKPFAANTVWEVLDKVQGGKFDMPRVHRPDIPEGVERIILQCLQCDQLKRYPTGKELAADLRRWLSGQTLAADDLTVLMKPMQKPSPGLPLKALLGVSLLAVVLLSTTLIVLLNMNTTPTPVQPSGSPPSIPILPSSVATSSTTPSSSPVTGSPSTNSRTTTIPKVEPKPIEVAPMPLALPSSAASHAEYARSLWWEAHTSRPLARKTRLLNATIAGLELARQNRDGQTARHLAWLGVSRVSLPIPDYATATKDLNAAMQATGAENEPLILVLRGLLDREKLISTAVPGTPVDLVADIANLNTVVMQFTKAVVMAKELPDRQDELSLAEWYATEALLKLVKLDQSNIRQQRAKINQAGNWLNSTEAKRWPETDRLILQSERLRLERDFVPAESLIRELLYNDRTNPELWLQRGRVLLDWGSQTGNEDQLKNAEKALFQARKWLESTETLERTECALLQGKVAGYLHLFNTDKNEALEFDPNYLQAVKHYQEAMNLAPHGAGVEYYEQAAFQLMLAHFSEATRLRRDTNKAKQLLVVIESQLKRAAVPFRDPVRGYFEFEKVQLRKQLGLNPLGENWLADYQSAVDIGTQPGAIAQDKPLQAMLYRLFASAIREYPKDAKQADLRAIQEAEKAAILADRTEVMSADEKSINYALAGGFYYQQATGNLPPPDKATAAIKGILYLRKAVESGSLPVEMWRSRVELARLLLTELTERNHSKNAQAEGRIWNLLREAEPGAKGVAASDTYKKLLTDLFDRFKTARHDFGAMLDLKLTISAEDKLLLEVAQLEMNLVYGKPDEVSQAREQLLKQLPAWKKLLDSWADDPKRDQLEAALGRLNQFAAKKQ